MGAEAGVQVVGPEVFFHAIVADEFLPIGNAGPITTGRGQAVCQTLGVKAGTRADERTYQCVSG